MSKVIGVLVIVISTIFSIASATPYQAKGLAGGYQDEKLGEGRYFVSFEGNGYTSKSTVVRYLNRRAQELCYQAGYKSYTLEFTDSNTNNSYWVNKNNVATIQKHEASAIVVCRKQ